MLRILIASLALHQVKEAAVVTQKEINTECKTLTYISLVLAILGLVIVAILHYRKSKLCRECMHVLLCSENYNIHFRCAILCTYKTAKKPQEVSICLKSHAC